MGTRNFHKITVAIKMQNLLWTWLMMVWWDNKFCWWSYSISVHDRRGKEGRNAFSWKENKILKKMVYIKVLSFKVFRRKPETITLNPEENKKIQTFERK
jgi:hypothetical protein